MEDRLITVAIHTYERAIALKSMLEGEGIEVSLQNVNLTQPVVASGIRVRIRENDLPTALRLIENAEIFLPVSTESESSKNRNILVPVDFSSHSIHACNLAFHFAITLKAEITLLHTFVNPAVSSTLQLSDSLNYELADSEMLAELEKGAHSEMNKFCDELRLGIKKGNIPAVRFTYEVREGIPEEVINTISKQTKPELIVMGTRGADTKERDLVGSVTAEVLDTCRYPVFTVPADSNLTEIGDIHRVLFFCTLDQEDLLALDQLERTLKPESLHVTLINIPSKKQSGNISAPFNALLQYCRNHYSHNSFDIEEISIKNVEDEFIRVLSDDRIDLIVVPNKKRNIFSRLFNPGLAHRLLFRADIPMMVVPV
ncbi:MAG: universal stress protein [Paramuribaculum sp.]|nr:universal stress protein [Paramuribaculum sp.]